MGSGREGKRKTERERRSDSFQGGRDSVGAKPGQRTRTRALAPNKDKRPFHAVHAPISIRRHQPHHPSASGLAENLAQPSPLRSSSAGRDVAWSERRC